MKNTILTLILLTVAPLLATPVWYLNMETINSYEIIGYGEGESFSEAKLMAKGEIAKQIKSTISSNTQQYISFQYEDIDKKSSKKTIETTSVQLQGLQVINKKREDDKFFIALVYENLPLEKRFARKVNSSTCKDEKQNPYLSKTPLFAKLNTALGCKLDIKLLRKDNLWYLSYENILEVLGADDFEELFVSVKPSDFEYEPSSFSLKESDEFFLKFTPKRAGFLSVLSVYEDGTVSVLFENQRVKKSQKLRFPSKKSDMFLEAGLLEPNRATFDNYIAILSDKKLNLSRFAPIDENLITGEQNKKFDELINFIKNRDFGVVLVRTRPR